MNSQYSREQIQEAIDYWEDYLTEAKKKSSGTKTTTTVTTKTTTTSSGSGSSKPKKKATSKKGSSSNKKSSKKTVPSKKGSTSPAKPSSKKGGTSPSKKGGKPSGKPSGKPTSKKAGTPSSKKGGASSGKPTGKKGGASSGKPSGKPAGKNGGVPSGKPTGKPTDTNSSSSTKEKSPNAYIPTSKEAKKSAMKHPIVGFDPGHRMFRVHRAAVENTIKATQAYLQGKQIGDLDVKVSNSGIDVKNQSFNFEADVVIGIHILLERTQMSGFQKFLTALKEDEELESDDGIDDMIDEADAPENPHWWQFGAKIDKADSELKREIGVKAIQTYLKTFIGADLAAEVDENYIYDGMNVKGDENQGRISFYCALKK